MSFPSTLDEARECIDICTESDEIEAELKDAVYYDGLVWQVSAFSARKNDIEYRLENLDWDVDRQFFFYPAKTSIDFVECPLCESRCKHTYSDNDAKCVNDYCCMKEFDAKKAIDDELSEAGGSP